VFKISFVFRDLILRVIDNFRIPELPLPSFFQNPSFFGIVDSLERCTCICEDIFCKANDEGRLAPGGEDNAAE